MMLMMTDDLVGQDIPIEQSLPPQELLCYYKTRIQEFESERSELLHRIEGLSVDQKEVHKLEWEARQRSGEIWELQKALSAANETLFRERGRLLKLQAESDDFRLRDDDNRKKIQYLLALTKTGEQEIKYLRQQKPDTVEIRPRDPQHERMLRTVYLPTANADSLILKVKSLQAQLNEQRQYCIEREEALLRDKRLNEEKMTNHRLNYEQQIEMAAHKIQKLEAMLRNCTRDYILARRGKQENEARAVAAESERVQKETELTERLQQLKEKATSQLRSIQSSTQSAIDTCLQKFQQQLAEKQEEILRLEKTFDAGREQYEGRIASLESKVAKLSAVNRHLETRRAQDLEGFVNEVSLLRKKLSVIDRRLHQMRLIERLSEDDRLDRMLQDLENKMPSFESEQDGAFLERTSSSTHLAEEVQKIQTSLIAIEQKIRHQRRSL